MISEQFYTNVFAGQFPVGCSKHFFGGLHQFPSRFRTVAQQLPKSFRAIEARFPSSSHISSIQSNSMILARSIIEIWRLCFCWWSRGIVAGAVYSGDEPSTSSSPSSSSSLSSSSSFSSFSSSSSSSSYSSSYPSVHPPSPPPPLPPPLLGLLLLLLLLRLIA